jgi:hypothetical protein
MRSSPRVPEPARRNSIFLMFGESPSMARSLVLVAAVLSPADLRQIDKYSDAWAFSPDEAQSLEKQAVADFAGRGTEIADYFLSHTDSPPRNDAYFFVLRAVGDTDTALTLIRALSNPPARLSGILDRHFGEIVVAVEAILTGDAARRDPRVVAALEAAVAAARRKPYGTGAHEALEALRLIGLSATDEAARALARLAADTDATVRAAAAAALGEVKRPVDGAADAPSPGRDLLRILLSDPNPPARRQAAQSLGLIDAPEAAPGLRAALGSEKDPRVVDAVVQSLHRRGEPLENPVECRGLIARTWEVGVAEQMLDCWRRSGVSGEELERMALTGGATERAMALFAVSTPAGQRQSVVVARAPERARMDAVVRTRLLDAAVWVLSQDTISLSVRDRAEQALWNLSEMRMDRALAHADRVTPTDMRFRTSEALARADAAAYDSTRRRRQAAVALSIALGFGVLGLFRSRISRPAVLIALSMAGWAAWTLQSSGVRNLPPPPLWLLSVPGIVFLSAGATTGAAALIARGPAHANGATTVRGILTMIVSGTLAGTVCFATRNAGLFPGDMAGWELIVDPLAAIVLAVVVTAILVVFDRLLFSRAS